MNNGFLAFLDELDRAATGRHWQLNGLRYRTDAGVVSIDGGLNGRYTLEVNDEVTFGVVASDIRTIIQQIIAPQVRSDSEFQWVEEYVDDSNEANIINNPYDPPPPPQRRLPNLSELPWGRNTPAAGLNYNNAVSLNRVPRNQALYITKNAHNGKVRQVYSHNTLAQILRTNPKSPVTRRNIAVSNVVRLAQGRLKRAREEGAS